MGEQALDGMLIS